MRFTRQKHILTTAIACALLMGGLALAQRPKENVSAGRHPNMAAAQRLSEQAWQKVVAAQEANEWDMQGHAQKAKNLLDEVNKELKLAAETANRNK
jgi:outer membrane biogenesis lipoprotein LolB